MNQEPEGMKPEVECESAIRPRHPIQPSASFGSWQAEYANSRGLLEYWDILKNQRRLILVFVLVGLLGGGAACLFQPPLFSPRATMEVQGLNERFMNMGDVDPQGSTGNYAATEINIQTQIEILESTSLRRQVIDKLDREAAPVLPSANDWLAPARARAGIVSQDPIEFTRSAIQQCALTLKAKPVRASRILEIRCDSPNAGIAANFLNMLLATYIDQSSEVRVQGLQKMGKWISGQMEDAKTRLEESEKRLRVYVESNGLAIHDEQETLADTRLKQLQAELGAVQSDRITKQTRYEMIRSTPLEQMPEAVTDTAVRTAEARVEEFKRQRTELLTTFTPANAKVKKLDEQLAQAEKNLRQSFSELAQRAKTDYEAAVARERLLLTAYGAQKGAVTAQAGKSVEYQLLKREVETNRQLYNNLMTQTNQASVATVIPASHVRVIDAASPPVEPAKPNYLVLLGAGAMTGLLGGCFAGFFRVRADSSVKAPGSATELFRVRELAVIPSSGAEARPWHVRAFPSHFRKSLGPANGNGKHEQLVTTLAEFSHAAESYRAAVRAIATADREGYRPRVVGITSPGPREGKTTVTSNLAVVLGEILPRVLVIDGDLRKPRLHTNFGVALEPGLVDLLRAEKPVSAYEMEELYRETAIPGVWVLPAGDACGKVGNLFYSPRLRALMARVRKEFDVVLIDTAPALYLADTCLLGQLTDGMIMVLRSGKTETGNALAARQELCEEGIPILGTILTDWDPRSKNYGYANGYYKSYEKSDS